MGRYYDGDIEGKFWFGVQSSEAANRFGVTGTCNYLHYYFSKEDLESVEKELEVILNNLGEYKDKLDKYFKENKGYNDEELCKYLSVDGGKLFNILQEYADYHLGIKIRDCLKQQGVCEFDAEM